MKAAIVLALLAMAMAAGCLDGVAPEPEVIVVTATPEPSATPDVQATVDAGIAVALTKVAGPTATLPPTETSIPTPTPRPTEPPLVIITPFPTLPPSTPEPTPTPWPTQVPWPTATPWATSPPAISGKVSTATPQPTATKRPAPLATAPTQTPALERVGETEYFSGEALVALEEAERLLDAGDYETAIRKYKEVLELRGIPSSVIEGDIGTAYSLLGEHSLAVHHYTRSLQVSDGSLIRAARSEAYYQLDRCDLAKHDAQASLNLPEQRGRAVSAHLNAHLHLADCYAVEENYAAVIQHRSQAIEIERELPDSQSESSLLEVLAWMHTLNSDCSSAETAADLALNAPAVIDRGYHSHAEAHWVLILCLAEAERWDDALKHAERALGLAIRNGYPDHEIADLREWVAALH